MVGLFLCNVYIATYNYAFVLLVHVEVYVRCNYFIMQVFTYI